MRRVWIDSETRNRLGIKYGTDRYTRTCECTAVTWCVDDSLVRLWEPLRDLAVPKDLADLLADPDAVFIAHNAPFDMGVLRFALKLDVPIERWMDTRAKAYAHGLPGSLELLGLVLQVPIEQQKLAGGKDLIKLFCEENAAGEFNDWDSHPVEWAQFMDYAVRDTEALRAIDRKLPTHNYKGEHLALWHLDQRINNRGFGFDSPLATRCREFLGMAKEFHDRAITDATAGQVTAPTQRDRLLAFIERKHGISIPNLRAGEVREMLERDDINPEVRVLLELRLEASKSSGSKYRRGLETVGPASRMRHCIQYAGAGRTGRFSGRNFQPHNMARPVLTVRRQDGSMELVPVEADYIDDVILPGIYSGQALNNDLVYGGPNEAAALALRHVIVAAPGNELVVADWSNIESRVLAWLAGEAWKLDMYRAVDGGEKVDPYKLLFSSFFGVPVESVNDNERQSGKVSELAFGFGGGVGALVTMSAGYQMDLDPLADLVLPRATADQLKKAERAARRAFLERNDYELEPRTYMACDVLKQSYRAANAGINTLRDDMSAAVKAAIREPGRWFKVGRCTVWRTNSCLIIQLPSGRRLLYWSPRVDVTVVQDIETGKPIHRETVSFMTPRGKTWRREKAWPGLFVQNVVQAVANDILRVAMLRVQADCMAKPATGVYQLPEPERTPISLHVHDEIALDVPRGSYPLKSLLLNMIEPTSWNQGLPLAATGWIGERYGKRKGVKA